MQFKAVATDIDGTITDADRKIVTPVIGAVRKLERRNVKVILVSGNVLPVTLGFKIFLGTTGPIISENGGMLFYENRIYKYFDKSDIEEAYKKLKEIMPNAERIFTDRWRETSIVLDKSLDKERIKEIMEGMGFRVEATGYGIHVTHREQTKLFGLKKAAELLNIDLDEIVAFGDSENDVDMLKGVGFGIAVNNAWEITKKNAKMVTEKKYGYGFVEGLKKLKMI